MCSTSPAGTSNIKQNVLNSSIYLTPRIITEPDKHGIENQEDDLDDEKERNVEILPPGPVEQIGRIAVARSTTGRRVTFTVVGNLRHISHQEQELSLVSASSDGHRPTITDSQQQAESVTNQLSIQLVHRFKLSNLEPPPPLFLGKLIFCKSIWQQLWKEIFFFNSESQNVGHDVCIYFNVK